MIYQVTANLFFSDEDEARDFYHDCELACPKGININVGSKDAEYSTVELIENHHDENPNSPCSLLSSIGGA